MSFLNFWGSLHINITFPEELAQRIFSCTHSFSRRVIFSDSKLQPINSNTIINLFNWPFISKSEGIDRAHLPIVPHLNFFKGIYKCPYNSAFFEKGRASYPFPLYSCLLVERRSDKITRSTKSWAHLFNLRWAILLGRIISCRSHRNSSAQKYISKRE